VSNPTPEQKELADIKAKRAALHAEREAREDAGRTTGELAEQRRLLALEEATLKAEADHGALHKRIAVVHARYADDTIAGSIIVKRPNHMIWKRFQSIDADKPKEVSDGLVKLIAHCLVFPTQDECDRLLEELPATDMRLLRAIAKLAGNSATEVGGK
jgi:hypothetical protein